MKFPKLPTSRVSKLEEEIKELKKRLFKEEKQEDHLSSYGSLIERMYSSMFLYDSMSIEEQIDILQDKVDALAKAMKVKFYESDAKDSEWKAKPIKRQYRRRKK